MQTDDSLDNIARTWPENLCSVLRWSGPQETDFLISSLSQALTRAIFPPAVRQQHLYFEMYSQILEVSLPPPTLNVLLAVCAFLNAHSTAEIKAIWKKYTAVRVNFTYRCAAYLQPCFCTQTNSSRRVFWREEMSNYVDFDNMPVSLS